MAALLWKTGPSVLRGLRKGHFPFSVFMSVSVDFKLAGLPPPNATSASRSALFCKLTSSRLLVELGGMLSLVPLHGATASACSLHCSPCTTKVGGVYQKDLHQLYNMA